MANILDLTAPEHTTIESYLNYDEDYVVRITCDEGYKFDNAPTLNYHYGMDKTLPFYLSNNDTVATSGAFYTSEEEAKQLTITNLNISGGGMAWTGEVKNNIPNTTDESKFNESKNYWDLNISANSGFRMAENAVATYEDTNGDFLRATLQMNGAKSRVTARITNNVDGNTVFEVNGATVDADALDLTNGVANTTVNTVKNSTGNYTITLTCNDGYKFDGIPKFAYTDDYGDYYNSNMTVSADGKTATITVTDIDPSGSCATSGNTIADTVTDVTVVNNIENTTEAHTFDGGTVTITVQSANYPRYRFISPKATFTASNGDEVSKYLDVTVNKLNSTATTVIEDIDPTKPITLTGKFVNVVHVETSLSNCTPTHDLPEWYENGETVNITLTANEGTEFNKIPSLGYTDEKGNPVTIPFTVSADKKTASVSHGLPSYEVSSITVYGEAEPVTVIGTNYGSINVYRVTLDELDQFAKKRFFRVVDEATGQYETIDLGQYVNRIKRIYAAIPTASTDVIKCGNYNTEIQVLAPSTDTVTLDFGTLTVPEYNGDNTDYESEITVFLPFRGFVTLPSDYVGKEVNLTYVINVITANGVAILSHNGVNFMVEAITPNNDLIYRTTVEELRLIGDGNWNELLYYGIEPFVNVKWFTSANRNDRNSDNARVVIGTTRGFNRFTEPTVISTLEMLSDEQSAIYDALQRGIYVE